ncbi:MAG: aldehyde-activating protein [Aquitalea sp.]|nr:aldehyde-activating protein [Aquitalea sp.]
MVQLDGACHCGTITLHVQLASPAGSYTPRACDCDFCSKHGASYVSDPQGSVRITVAESGRLNRYRQGSQTAEFLLCAHCGVLLGVQYQESGLLYLSINSRVLDNNPPFPPPQSASPKLLSPQEKTQRWKALWFRDCTLQLPEHDTGSQTENTA